MNPHPFAIAFILFCSFVAIGASFYSLWLVRIPQTWWYNLKEKRRIKRLIKFYNKEFLRLEQLAIKLAGTERFNNEFMVSKDYITLPEPYPERFGLWEAFCRNLCYDAAAWHEEGISKDEIQRRLTQRVADRPQELATLKTELSTFRATMQSPVSGLYK